MKVERYIKQYAKAKINSIESDETLSDVCRMRKRRQIRKALHFREKGTYDIENAIRTILEA